MTYVIWILVLYGVSLAFLEAKRWWARAILLALVVSVGLFPAIYYVMVVK